MDGSTSLATAINNTMTDLLTNFGFQPGGGSQSLGANPLGLFTTAGSFDTSCISTDDAATLIAPQFVLMANHRRQGGGTFGGDTIEIADDLTDAQEVLTPTGGDTDLAVGLLATPATNATPAEVLPADYAAYLQPSAEDPIYAVRADQNRQLALSDWFGTETTTGDSGELEMGLNTLSPSDPLYDWGTEPDTGKPFAITNDSGNGVFLFFDVQGSPQTVLLGALHDGEIDGFPYSSCSDLSDNMALVNETMAELWAEGQAQNVIPTNVPPEQLTTVDLSGYDRSYPEPVTLSLQGSQLSADATQALTYKVAANLSSGAQVTDGESVVLEDVANNNAAVGSGTFAGNTATITLAPGTLADGTHQLVAVCGGDANYALSVSNEVSLSEVLDVASVQLNGNNPALAGAQQSMVDSIVYTFSEPVNCAPDAFGIALYPYVVANGVAGPVGTLPTLSAAALDPNADGSSTQWVLTFSGDGVVNGSIANGVYYIPVTPGAITSDVNPSVSTALQHAVTFYRLYGDINGDETVSAADFVAFSNCFGESAGAPGYNAGFDEDGATTIDAADFVLLSNDFGTVYSVTVPILY